MYIENSRARVGNLRLIGVIAFRGKIKERVFHFISRFTNVSGIMN